MQYGLAPRLLFLVHFLPYSTSSFVPFRSLLLSLTANVLLDFLT